MTNDPESSTDNGMSPEEIYESVRVIHTRYFLDFDSSLLLNCAEEISFYNNGNSSLNRVIYDAWQFLPQLKIYDSNGELLVFHKNFTINDQEIRVDEEKNSEHAIIIEFPQNRPVDKNHFRVIVLKYVFDLRLEVGGRKNDTQLLSNKESEYGEYDFDLISNNKRENDIDQIRIPFKGVCSIYIWIKKLNEFVGQSTPLILIDNQTYNLNPLIAEGYVKIEDTPTYYGLSLNFPVDTEKFFLLISTTYQLPKWNYLWFNGGAIIGYSAVIFNEILLLEDPKLFLTAIIAIAVGTNSYLILTKGWIFTKAPVERVLKIDYTEIYLLLISSLFIEIFIACLLAFWGTCTNQNVNITSVSNLSQTLLICLGQQHG